jgi:ABC-type uncharacterized transport system substrate-binding protein
VLVTDPLFSGLVQSLRSPGGTVTGFSLFEGSVGGKWLALLKEAAPAISRVSLFQSPDRAFRGELSAISGGGGANAWHNRCLCNLG